MNSKKISTGQINDRFFINPETYLKKFNLDKDCYGFKLYDQENQFRLSKGILFDKEYTENGLLLKYQDLDLSVLGFNILENSVSDCLQIQGGSNRYKYLTPIRWDNVLLDKLIDYSRELSLDSVRVIPSYSVKRDNSFYNVERLIKRYDQNAKFLGFKYSCESDRYVLDLK